MNVEIHRDPNTWGDVKAFLASEFPGVYLALRRAKDKLLIPILPPSVETKAIGDIQFSIAHCGPKERTIAKGPAYEEELIQEMLGCIKPGDIIWDVGAAIGTHAIPSAIKTGPNGLVYAIEPDDTCRKTLEMNLRLNRLTNICILPIALWDRDADLTVHASDRQRDAAQVTEKDQSSTRKFEHHFSIRGRSIQSLVADGTTRPPDVIKIDVEGGAQQVLEGSRTAWPREIFIEVHPKMGEDRQQIVDFLTARGYGIASETPRGGEIHLHFSLTPKVIPLGG